MLRRTPWAAGLAGVVLAASVVVVPGAAGARSPVSVPAQRVAGVQGSTSLTASATGPGAATVTAPAVNEQHTGNLDETSVEALSEGELGTAQVEVTQNAQATSSRLHLGGTSVGSRGGGNNSATNQASLAFTPTATAWWDVTIDGTATSSAGNGNGCPFGAHVAFTGLGTHEIPCTGQRVLVQKRLKLVAGTTYTFDGGHGNVGDLDGSFFFAFEATKVVPVANVKVPTISGTAKVGKKLTATRGTWSGKPTRFAFQWFRGTSKIRGATKASYTCTKSDKGKKLKVVVTASKTGSKRSATSKATKAVAK